MKPSPAFTAIAPYYDKLMAEVDYEAWARYAHSFLVEAEIEVKKVMDLACGTGNLTAELLKLGYEVWGLDASPQMLEVAKRKLPGVRFVLGDFRSWGVEEVFDAVICVYDSLNNILSSQGLLEAFREVRRHLRPGGLFLFDLNTVWGLRELWGTKVRVEEGEGILSVWRTRFVEPDLSELWITVFVQEGERWVRVDEVHVERGYEPAEVARLLREAGFSKVQVFRAWTRMPAGPRTPRAYFVASV